MKSRRVYLCNPVFGIVKDSVGREDLLEPLSNEGHVVGGEIQVVVEAVEDGMESCTGVIVLNLVTQHGQDRGKMRGREEQLGGSRSLVRARAFGRARGGVSSREE